MDIFFIFFFILSLCDQIITLTYVLMGNFNPCFIVIFGCKGDAIMPKFKRGIPPFTNKFDFGVNFPNA